MAHPKISLACDIIEEEFGPATKAVCGVLLERSSATLDEIVKVSGIEKSLAKDCLLSAIQHNFVVAMEEERHNPTKRDDAPIVIAHYRILIDNVIIRLRFGKFVGLMRDKFAEADKGDASEVIKYMLLMGRTTVKQMVDYELFEPGYFGRQRTLDAMRLLRDKKFIMPIPEDSSTPFCPCRGNYGDETESSLDLDDLMAPRKKKLPVVEPGKAGGKEQETAVGRGKRTGKASAAATARAKKTAPSLSSRKAVALDVAPEMGLYESENQQEAQSKQQQNTDMQIDEPVIPVQMPSNTQSNAAETQTTSSKAATPIEFDESKFCVDYNRFNKEFCKDACISFVGEKIDAIAGGIMKEMFEISESSKMVSEDRLYNNLTNPEKQEFKSTPLSTISRDRLRNYLDLMTKDNAPLLTKIQQPIGYTINVNNIVDTLKQKMIESIIMDKFGSDSLRIFRLLGMKKLLEQKQVSELAMTPIKETRDCLYKMLAKNFVHLQEVPRTSEHNPSKTFYLWSVRWQHITQLVTSEMYKIIRNLKHRLNHTLEQHRDLILKEEEEERIKREVGEESAAYEIMTELERDSLQELKIIQERLEISISHVDDTLMTIADF